MLERDFQADLIKEIKMRYPKCIVMKNDSSYIQGIPDLLVLYMNRWAALEVKRSQDASLRPNQRYYISIMNDMSYAAIVCPENRAHILAELDEVFGR